MCEERKKGLFYYVEGGRGVEGILRKVVRGDL